MQSHEPRQNRLQLNARVFERLYRVRQIVEEWMIEYNEERPHDVPGKIPPSMFREQVG